MKRTSLVVAVLVFVSVLFVGLSFIPEVRATTRYVGGAGPGNYTTIQDAVDNASLGDTVFVYGGTYQENVIVNRTLTLIGEDRNTTVIDGNASGDAVHVAADRVNISGFTITNSGDMNGRAGIEINRSHDCRVTGNSITDNNDGLYVLNSNYTSITNNSFSLNANNSITVYASHNSMLVSNTIFRRDASLRFSDGSVILNNSFSNNGYGIDLMNTSNSTVSGNTFMANNGGIYAAYSRDTVMASNTFTHRTGKIYLSWSGNMTLVNNDFAQGGILLWGENMADHNTHTIMGNQVGGLPIHYYKDCDGVMVDGIPIGQLFMANCSNVRASNLDFFNVTVGIEMAFTDGGLIENVSVAGARYGIFLHQSNNNVTIADSNISGNWGDGIIVRSSTNNTILNTTTSFNSLGIWLYESMASTVENNTASSNTRGILSSSSGHDTIRNNTVIGNHFGLHIGGSSHNSTVAGNNVSESTDKGIILTYTRDNVVANNTAFYNRGGAIYVDDSTHNLIADNTGTRGGSVVTLYDSNHNTVVGNTAIHSEGSGISLLYSHNNTVVNNTAESSNYSGISVVLSTNNAIMDNHLLNNSVAGFSFYSGIYLSRSDQNSVLGNRISRNLQKNGIYLESSMAANITDNTMNGSGFVITGQSLKYWNTHRIDTSNTINGRPAQYWKNRTGGTVPAGAGQVILANCTDVSVVGQNLSNTAIGLVLGFSSNNTLSDNTASSNRIGMSIYVSDNNTVNENTISDNYDGMEVFVSQENRIFHNEFVDNTVQAIEGFAFESQWDDGYPSGGNYWSDYVGVDQFSGPNQDVPGPDGIGDVPYDIWVNSLDRYPLMSARREFLPPRILSVLLNGMTSQTYVLPDLPPLTLTAVLDDSDTGGSWIGGSNFILGSFNWSSSSPMQPSDGAFDSPLEAAYAGIPAPNESGNYSYCVYAWDVGFNINATLLACANLILMEAPPYPKMLGASLDGLGLRDVRVSWQRATDDGAGENDIVRYDIYRSTDHGGPYGLVDSVPANGSSSYEWTCLDCGVGDPNEYFFYVEANDSLLSTASPNRAAKVTRNLLHGLRLISIPLVQSNESIERVLQTVMYDKAWAYDSSTQKWMSHSKSKSYQTLEGVNHTMGLWVNVTQNSNLIVAGIVPVQTTIHLQKGWNLVSFPSFNMSYSVMDLKAETGATRVEGYDPVAAPNFLRVLEDADLLQAGWGYWMNVAADTDWIIEAS